MHRLKAEDKDKANDKDDENIGRAPQNSGGYSDAEHLAEISNNIRELTHILGDAMVGLVRGQACLWSAQASLMVLTHRHDHGNDHNHHGHDHGHDGHHGHDGDGGCSQCESDSNHKPDHDSGFEYQGVVLNTMMLTRLHAQRSAIVSEGLP